MKKYMRRLDKHAFGVGIYWADASIARLAAQYLKRFVVAAHNC
jgi:hypothetical protein